MSNLKDTDIDDLFRRASDKYPLRTDSADWDRMAAALDDQPPPAAGTVDGEDKRRKRRFFWLFLLLPLGGAGYYTLHHAGASARPAVAGRMMSRPAGASTPRPAAGLLSGRPADARTGQQQVQGQTDERVNDAAPRGRAHDQTNGRTDDQTSFQTSNQTLKPGNTLSLTAAPRGRRPGGESRGGSQIAGRGASPLAGPGGSPLAGPGGSPLAGPGGSSLAGQGGSPLAGPGEDRLFYDLQRASIPRDYQLAVNVKAPAAKKDTAAAATKNTAAAKAKQHSKHFYAGLIAAPDLSMVKMQSVKGVGSTFGVLLGYSLNGRWSVESGVYVDRKKYYTDGEYFDTKNVRLPTNADLLDVNGVCYMWEIPLNVRYNFNPGAKTAWFATAGFSTYLMSREKYAYGYTWYGSGRTWDSTWNIHQPSQYPFSIINLSAGFEQRLGKIGSLRVEPYVRLPLTGLGTGKLPIMSAGVNIGITRQLW